MDRRAKSGEVLLRLRRQQEAAARDRFARARGEAGAIAARMDRLRTILGAHTAAARAALLAGAGDASVHGSHAAGVRDALAAAGGKLAEAQRAAERQREALVEALRCRKAAAGLAGRRARRAARVAARREAAESDDLHAARRARGADDGELTWPTT